MKKLISMTEFVLQQKQKFIELGKENYDNSCLIKSLDLVLNYAEFLSQPLTLGMFVPVNRNGEPYDLIEVEAWKNHDHYSRFYKEELSFFEEAKEKVLFEGYFNEFYAIRTPEGGYLHVERLKGKTIETIIGSNLELTPSALNQIGI